ncbi:PepSY domain-containing protein [Loktanella sp. M215]|uniref:PepSY domain-containing protein n=1 Tax=Loktanella sp. M215 TaxID=2675431 RepID=UPI001F2A80E3|nr:PepSY domain-containing protein [Loktanella sp. M215]MCF7698944.1 N-acetylglucosamine transferase [Loktanella sp. M215]
MIRVTHRWPGLLALALLLVLTISGAVLSVFPAAERLSAPQAAADLTVAALATRIVTAYPGVEQIKRSPSGKVTAFWFDGDTPGSAVIDPATGQGAGSADPNPVERWLTTLHRSLFLDDTGRIVSAIGAGAMMVLAISGVLLVRRRVGGLRRWFTRLRGPLAGRIHVEIARVAVVGLALSSLTALWMTASTFGLIPDTAAMPAFPAQVSGQTGVALSSVETLQNTPVADLRALSFPYAGDATDVLTLTTDSGTGYIDQGTGALLGWADLTGWAKVSETVYMLHTGQGAAALGLVLGLMALGVPIMGVTGVILWWSRRRDRPRLAHNHPAATARTILLVGSEGGSTWSFAATLHAALTTKGQTVHAAPMSSFDAARCARAQHIIVMAATYGDGDAPTSAKGFLDQLAPNTGTATLTVLGFGDRSFPAFCAYAAKVAARAEALGWHPLTPTATVDRQSPQDFARWGRDLGQAMGLDLTLDHQPTLPKTHPLTLIARRDYGTAVQAPTAILRFAVPHVPLWQRLTGRSLGRFQAGDLLGILPAGSAIPRFYSLASARRDGFIEIVVRKHANGLCSGQLMALEPGDTMPAFVRQNASFHAGRDRTPLILIGAGTGISPLAGFIRANDNRRPLHLFFGMRHPDSDFLYGTDLTDWQASGRLAELATATSRGARKTYVQDTIRAEAPQLDALIRSGARIMVCGGRDMAAGVSEALAEILMPTGLTPAALKADGRYVEDVY